MKRLKMVVILVTLLLCCVMASASYAATPEKKFKLGYIVADNGTTHSVYSKIFADLVSEYSGGRFAIDIYPAAQLGNERDLYEGAQMGTVDFVFGGTAVLSYFTEEFFVFDVPYLFRNYKEAYAVYDSPLMEKKLQALEKTGIRVFGVTEIGFNSLVSNAEIKFPQDLKGRTIRVAESPVIAAFLKALGVNPVTIPFSEAFTVLQNGTVDGLFMPLATHYLNQYHTIAKYLIINSVYATQGILVGSQITLNKLSEEDRKIFERAGIDAIAQGRLLAEDLHKVAVEQMVSEGVTLIEPDLNDWYDYVQKACWQSVVDTKLVKMEEIEEVRKIADTAK